MSAYNNNPEVRSRTAYAVQTNFGRIILLKLAQGTVSSMLFLFYFIIGAPLQAGYTYGLLELVRGNGVKVNILFSRFRQILASILLSTWTTLKTLAWLLPGLLIAAVGAIMVIIPSMELVGTIGAAVVAVGAITCFVLWIQAYYRYSMAHIAFADDPELDVYDAVECSKEMMRGRKFQLFRLTIPYLLIRIAVIIVLALLIFVATMIFSELPDLAFLGGILILIAAIAAIGSFIYIALLEELVTICFYEENRP